ncbi:MAG: hypothetical protein JW892_09625 [Anaerolineae bacterium]|nr:hypothetical protein [Anaerolineae bacterium]
MYKNPVLRIIVWVLVACLLTGCSDLVDHAQDGVSLDCEVELVAGTSVGQTFVARHGGLDAVEISLRPESDAKGELILHLCTSPTCSENLVIASLAFTPGAQTGIYRFDFSPILNSHTRYFYAFWEPGKDFSGTIHVPCAEAERYVDGALYSDHVPMPAQAVFRLSYAPEFILLDLLQMVAGWLGYGLASITLLFFSGYILTRGWARHAGADFTATLVMSSALALAVWMALLLWANLLSMTLSAWAVRGLVGIAGVGGALTFLRDREMWRKRSYWLGESPVVTAILWLCVLGAIGFRLFVGRSLVMLPGSDTYHHTLIAKLFEEQGGLPNTYQPYAPLVSFSYHFGFHSIIALFRWVFGTELLLTTKTVALVLNGAIAATAAFLSERITGNRKTGVVVALLVGLIIVSPFCLLRWGRFTQTAGMFFLPLAVLPFLARDERRSSLLVWALLIAALVFAHNREAFFAMILLGIVAIPRLLRREWMVLHDWLWMGIFAVLIALPWLVRIAWVQLDPQGLRVVYEIVGGYNDLSRLELPVLSFITNIPVLALFVMGAVATLLDREYLEDWILVFWTLALVAGGVLYFQLTGSFHWDLKTSLLTLSVPVAVFLGIRLTRLVARLQGAGRWVLWVAVLLLLGIGCVVAGVQSPAVLNGGMIYLRPGDLIAMNWIETHTSPAALFVPNASQVEWSPDWLIGSDAGYWLPLLAQRDTTLPPMIYAWETADASVLQQDLMNTHAILDAAAAQESLPSSVVCCTGVTHFIAYDNNWPMTAEDLLNTDTLELLYQQDRLQVFEVVCPEVCP